MKVIKYILFILTVYSSFLSIKKSTVDSLFEKSEIINYEYSHADSKFFKKTYLDVSKQKRKYNHSPSITSLPDNKLIAVWYAGEREGGTDMELKINHFDGEKWNNEKTLITSKDLPYSIRRIGNPIIFNNPINKKIHVIFTTTLTGWATSILNIIHSNDNGKSWSKPKKLYLGNIINISHLVRCKPFFYTNGNIGIPAYHEFINKFGIIININQEGKVFSTYKLSKLRDAIQPCITFNSQNQGIAFLRNTNPEFYGSKILINKFNKNFKGKLETLDIFNNNTSVATLKYKDKILLLYNDSKKPLNLTLGLLDSKLKFKKVLVLEKNFSKYPYMIKNNYGVHIVYSGKTNNKHTIKHVFIPNGPILEDNTND